MSVSITQSSAAVDFQLSLQKTSEKAKQTNNVSHEDLVALREKSAKLIDTMSDPAQKAAIQSQMDKAIGALNAIAVDDKQDQSKNADWAKNMADVEALAGIFANKDAKVSDFDHPNVKPQPKNTSGNGK